MSRSASLLALVLAIASCAAPSVSPTTSGPTASAEPSVPAAPSAEPTSTPSPTPFASVSADQLFGTWRTTLGGANLILRLTPETYRIVRGSNAADGDVSVDGDRIDFFNSSLCPGTGEYRWRIEGDSLRFSSLTEPCPGRAEALLNVRYSDYSPPD
jgi:hypothetical protein